MKLENIFVYAGLVLLVFVLLTACSVKGTVTGPSVHAYDSKWSEGVNELMLRCGQAAVKITSRPEEQDVVYGLCLKQLGATI